MKKYRLLLLLSALLFFLGACGDKKQEKGSESKESTVRQSKDSSATSETKKAESSSDKKEKTKMDIEAIAQGDYSSVAGVWQDDKGNKLVFDQNGLVSNEYESYGLSLTDYGTVSGGVYGGVTGGFLMEFIPAGLTIDDQTDENGEVIFHDDSDVNKDRLWTGTGMYSFTEQGSFLYKVGD